MAYAMVPFEGLVLTKDLIEILIRDLNSIDECLVNNLKEGDEAQ